MLVAYRRQILAAVAATVGAFGLGTVLGYTASALPDLKNTDAFSEMDMEMESWIGSIVNLGAFAATIIVGILLNKIGRKLTMLLLSAPFILGWLLIVFAKTTSMLLIGRFITGFCGGGFSLAAPLFVTEIAEDQIRGRLGTTYQIMVTFGVLFVYVAGFFSSWQWLAIFCGFVPLAFLVAMIFIPETPRCWILKGMACEAKKSLAWFRPKASLQQIEDEIEKIEQSEMNQGAAFREIFEARNLRPSLLVISLMGFQQLSGVNAMIFYTKKIFQAAKSEIEDGLSTVIVGIVQFVATCFCIPLIDKIGRKPLLLISSVFMCVSLTMLSVYFELNARGVVLEFEWLPPICLILFVIAYGIGYGPIPMIMMGELIPQKIKVPVASFAISIGWLLSFLVTKFIDRIQETLTIQWCYLTFAIVCAIGFVFVWRLLPETKGKSLQEIQNYFYTKT